MLSRWSRLLAVASFTSIAAVLVLAQDATPTRKVTRQVNPPYPEMARPMRLAGTVRIEVTVNPNGTVKDTKVIGGNPVLAAAAEGAVKNWKYEPAKEESKTVVVMNFKPE